MGKDLHPSIMPFILDRLRSHQNVNSIENISTAGHYIFRITRNSGLCDVIILVSDAYHFSEFDYLSNPIELINGGFVLIAKPESSFPSDIQHQMKVDKVIIGKIGILLGALRINEFWNYEKPKEERKKQ